MHWNKSLAAIFCVASAWAGAPGAHSPDLDQRSQLVHDLRATRKGHHVTLNWSQPRQITDRQSLARRPVVGRVCRDISSTVPQPASASTSITKCGQLLREVDPAKAAAAAVRFEDKNTIEIAVQFTDRLPEVSGPSQFAHYAVELRDNHGRSAGFSNPVAVSLAPIRPAEGLHPNSMCVECT